MRSPALLVRVWLAIAAIHFASLFAGAPGAMATPMFLGLGDLAGGSFTSDARGISADGSTVVGSGSTAAGQEAFRWTMSTGMVGLGDLAGGGIQSSAGAVSADGSVVVGQSLSSFGSEAMRWTAGGGMAGLGDLSGGGSLVRHTRYLMTAR